MQWQRDVIFFFFWICRSRRHSISGSSFRPPLLVGTRPLQRLHVKVWQVRTMAQILRGSVCVYNSGEVVISNRRGHRPTINQAEIRQFRRLISHITYITLSAQYQKKNILLIYILVGLAPAAESPKQCTVFTSFNIANNGGHIYIL